MAQWNATPTWVAPASINSGQQYDAGDGLTYLDMRGIVHNLIYLYNTIGTTNLPLKVGKQPGSLHITEGTAANEAAYSLLSGTARNYGEYSIVFGTGGQNLANRSFVLGDNIYTYYNQHVFAMGEDINLEAGGFFYGMDIVATANPLDGNCANFVIARRADIDSINNTSIITYNTTQDASYRRAYIDSVTTSTIFAEGPHIDNTSRSFIAGYRPEITGDYSGYNYGNFVFGINYINDARGQYTMHNIRHCAFLGPYMTAYESYADTVLGSTQSVYETQYCYIGGHNNTIRLSNGAYVFGRSINAADIDHSMVTGSYHNIVSLNNCAIFGESMDINPSQNIYDSDSGTMVITSYVLGGGKNQDIEGSLYSVINGEGNYIYDCNRCIVIGKATSAESTSDTLVIGDGHSIGELRTDYSATVGSAYIGSFANDIGSQYTYNFGYGLTGRRNLYSSIVGKYHNVIDTEYSTIAGYQHTVQATHYSAIFGNVHNISGVNYSLVTGQDNKLECDQNHEVNYCVALGYKIKIAPKTYSSYTTVPKFSAVIGESCHSYNAYNLTFGYGLLNNNIHEMIVGRFATIHLNTPNATHDTGTRYLLTVGDGISNDQRKDALSFYAQNGEYFLKMGNLVISETKMKKIMDFIDSIV